MVGTGRSSTFMALRDRLIAAMPSSGAAEFKTLMQSFGAGPECDPYELTQPQGEAAFRKPSAVGGCGLRSHSRPATARQRMASVITNARIRLPAGVLGASMVGLH